LTGATGVSNCARRRKSFIPPAANACHCFKPLRLPLNCGATSPLNVRVNEPAAKTQTKVLICLGLGLVTLLLYLPSLRQGFLPYDDQQYVTENRQVQSGLNSQGLTWAFGYHAGNWHPLTWLSHMLDCDLYGLKPAGHHLTNVVLHVTCTLLLFLLWQRLTGALWRSALVAAFFGWHPLHVESVAWVAERKDVLCAWFWMLTLLAYASYAQKLQIRGRSPEAAGGRLAASKYYWLTLLCFGLALLSKPMAVTLPFVLLLLDFWPLKRFTIDDLRLAIWPLVREKLPFFALSGAACALTLAAQQVAIVSTAGLPISQRITHALVSYVHYLVAAFAPRHLSIYYPYETNPPTGQIVLAGVLLLLISVVAIRCARQRPYFIIGWLWYIGTLVPVIGLAQVGDQAWADRYTYIPLIGIFVAVVWVVAEMLLNRWALRTLTIATGAALLITTTRQLGYWKDTRTLFEHAARVTPNNFMAITMLGSLLAQEGKLEEAIENYHRALKQKPTYAEAYFFLGNALDQQGKLDDAIAAYQQALRFKPLQEQTHMLLGVALARQQKFAEARTHYQAVLKLNPESAEAHNNLARIFHTEGRLDDAIAHYSAALALNPELAQAHNNLGILLLQKGDLAGGTDHLRTALRLDPANRETQYNLALALNQQAQWSEAAELFGKTVAADSADANAHYQFAIALAHLNRTREAMSRYASSLLLQPDQANALDGLAWILATASVPEFRNGPEAVRMAERACQLTDHYDPAKLLTLAAAYAEVGRFADASATAERAQELATRSGKLELAAQCQRLRERFTAGLPWRDERSKE
jgi:protein O-mannosyl-transferase